MGGGEFSDMPFLSESADRATREIMLVAAEWERSFGGQLAGVGLQGASVGGATLNLTLASLTQISRCVSAVEVFTFDRVMECIDSRVLHVANPILDSLYKDKKKSIDGSWDSIRKAAVNWLEIDFLKIGVYQKIEGYVEVRNATLHAAGKITRRQRGNLAAVIKKMNLVGVKVFGDRLAVKDGCVRECAICCRDFVRELDRLLKSEFVF
ncbi:hypothetical protein GCM10027598_19270 [Amycolatopsis oliviviridis]|uniref:RiboL-PSP-HEPN domain-containing protein n=1 Tax=Amycolatopsis oliviviridis TaxID=1471590 RepID=A0ABQ3LH65_9PSEU|nr:hypothetical protein [Amycolatopsis oliviviridis]GHH14036.1 hypothetical protein GCM10017790_26920 [Amycolatopsis oliviviridis]